MAMKLTPKTKMLAISVGALVVLAVVLLGLPWSGLRVIVSNANLDMEKIRVVVRIDGELKAISDVYPQEQVVLGDWTVRAGSHKVEINYDYAENSTLPGLEDPPEWAQHVDVGLFTIKNVYVGVH